VRNPPGQGASRAPSGSQIMPRRRRPDHLSHTAVLRPGWLSRSSPGFAPILFRFSRGSRPARRVRWRRMPAPIPAAPGILEETQEGTPKPRPGQVPPWAPESAEGGAGRRVGRMGGLESGLAFFGFFFRSVLVLFAARVLFAVRVLFVSLFLLFALFARFCSRGSVREAREVLVLIFRCPRPSGPRSAFRRSPPDPRNAGNFQRRIGSRNVSRPLPLKPRPHPHRQAHRHPHRQAHRRVDRWLGRVRAASAHETRTPPRSIAYTHPRFP